MKIDNKVSELLRTGPVSGARGASSKPNVEPVVPAARIDRVQISETGRALAAREAAAAEGALTPEQIARLRQRVQDGTYNSAAVADAIARRLVQGGEI